MMSKIIKETIAKLELNSDYPLTYNDKINLYDPLIAMGIQKQGKKLINKITLKINGKNR